MFEQVVAFSEFGFPKSHAAAFGLLAYQSAWLRDRYPTEYYVGLFNNQPMGFYSLDAIGRDARRHEVGVRLPDLNASEVACTAEGDDVRIGLGMVRDWGTEVAELVVAERARGGPFASLPDFLRRTPATLKRDAIENLIWVGGFDSLGVERRDLLWQTGLWLGPEAETETERRRRELATSAAGLGGEAPPVKGRRGADRADRGQIELALDDPYADLRFAGTHDMEKMIAEYRILSFAASQHHPFALVGDHLPERTVSSARFPDLPNGSAVRVAGIVVARQRPQTAKGYIFILMEDESGPINAIVKPDVYRECRAAIRLEPFLYIDGTLQKDGATYNVIAEGVYPLRLSPELHLSRETVPPVEGEADTAAAPVDLDIAEEHPAETPAGTPSEAPSDSRGEPARPDPAPNRIAAAANRNRLVAPDPFAYLEALRRDPPPTMSWGRGGGCR